MPVNGLYFIKLSLSASYTGVLEVFLSVNKGGHNSSPHQDLNAADGYGPLSYANGSNGIPINVSGTVSLTTSDYICFGFYTSATGVSIGQRTSATITLIQRT